MTGLPEDLLALAQDLTLRKSSLPTQAHLRRAVSSAYYALFHLLVAEAVNHIGQQFVPSVRQRIARVFSHTEMKQVCRMVSNRRLSDILQELVPGGFSPELEFVANAFNELQTARHTADYDLGWEFAVLEARAWVDTAREAFASWSQVSQTEEADVFLAALLFNSRWSK